MPAAVAVRRPAGVIALAVALVAFEAVWLLAGWRHRPHHPVIGWLPVMAAATLSTYASLRAARRPDMAATTRRFWRTVALANGVLAIAELANTHDALTGPSAPGPSIGPVTMTLLLAVVLLMVWALLRLPAWRHTRGDWARFALDAGVLVITCGGFLWRYWLGTGAEWTAQNGAMLAICALALIVMIAIVKIAFAGTGEIDRRALHILSAGIALSAGSGALAPAFVERPWLTTSFLAGPIASMFTVFAAERQRHTTCPPPTDRRTARISVLPYVAVAAMTALLLAGEARDSSAHLGTAICVAALTALVVTRQVSALRDNRRLLETVDANLGRLREYQAELDHQIGHDALTGIANRSLFAEQVTSRLGAPLHVALLDLDDFKVINDRMGHGMGDALLRAVSERLHERLRPSDFIARQGGDEFTLLLSGPSSAGEITELLRDVLDRVQQPLSLGGQDLAPRVSIGVTAARPGDTPEELIRRADVAMYAAKNNGGGRCMWFDPVMDQIADADARLAADLRQAIARDELFVLYQPIVELPHGRLAGVEALIRWRHPVHGLVSPAVFIPLAERNGYIVELGRWVLREVVRQAREWELTYGDAAPEKVSVNISARQLREPDFPAEVDELLRSSGLTPHRLVAEVTETAVLGTGEALDAVRALHALGLRVALDDFGTGQSSLSLLVDCPVKILKVDKSFVDGVTGASAQAVIVDGLIGITEGLRIEAVAEGVETADQAYRLHKMGYRFAQGFHFARPMPGADIALLLEVVPASVPSFRSSLRESRQSPLI
ncbi:putative bifunctional diguanylate cyclase/phosphodiesterase [Actinoplanes subtropicus]|uniref:putative bifunctional diguanylate cyclase/phosphodiesterase n=1 Tax=Actinoplanes subtropicus TaxID=543632 RepID=UPI00068C4FB4|nr:bifunctional diguanylate cyclase/phosphodiesterase [Actinoplanes subtropicus]